MFHHILVPLDGSPCAEQALPGALRIARKTGASITLLQVIPPSQEMVSPMEPIVVVADITEASIEAVTSYLTKLAATEQFEGIGVHHEVLEGDAGQMIVQYAQERHIDLIVLCSHGRTGLKRLLMGSVARYLTRMSIVPVLILHMDGAFQARNETARPVRFFVALDGSPFAEAILPIAAELCQALAAPRTGEVHLLHVAHLLADVERHTETITQMNVQSIEHAKAYLKQMERRFQDGDLATYHLTVTSSVMFDTDFADIPVRLAAVSKNFAGVAGTGDYDVIAMATHGRRGVARWMEGSITEHVFDLIGIPLLTLHVERERVEQQEYLPLERKEIVHDI